MSARLDRLPQPWPTQPGAYRWLYADVSAGEYSAVAIFMVGAVFSPRHSVAARRGESPLDYCAVNFALYGPGGSLCWAFSEYAGAQRSERRLTIGSSTLELKADGSVEAHVVERTPWWGKLLEAQLTLSPLAPPHAELQLSPGTPHHWQPLMPRASAVLHVRAPEVSVDARGLGYLDTNRGDEALGGSMPGWRWMRAHGEHQTRILYEPPGTAAIEVVARDGATHAWRTDAPAAPLRRNLWGLPVPASLDALASAPVGPVRQLESSPFYGRLEASGAGTHALCEVADFQRFHRPHIRWMARWRSRVGTAPVERRA